MPTTEGRLMPSISDEPAFPVIGGLHEHQFAGMSLRDYLAAKAMQGMVGGSWPDALERAEIGRRAYLMADAMLAARAAE